MGRDLRIVNMAEGQKIESDKIIKRMGEISYRDLGVLAKIGLFDTGKALITSGLKVASGGGMVVNIPVGAMLQRLPSGDILPIISTTAQTLTMDAASGVARTDMVECQVKKVIDKNDVAQSVLDSSTGIINLETIKRDVKYYLAVQKKTSTTTATAATAAILSGTVGIAGTIDLSANYLINIGDGEDGNFQEIDLRGATPEATTGAEIVANINAAVGRVMASIGGGSVINLTGNGTGITSYFEIKPPVSDSDADALETVFGVSAAGAYNYIYEGVNDWIKLAEIDIDTATTVITAAMIRNIDLNSTWASDGSDVINGKNLYDYINNYNSMPPDTKSYNDLLVKRNAGAAASKVDISFDEMYLGWMKTGSQSFTLDITASGLLGLDTGSENTDLWYYIWIIAKADGTVSAILSASSTAPTMPLGYTFKRLVSMVRNTSGNFVDFYQTDFYYYYTLSPLAASQSVFGTNTIDCSVYIPDLVKKIDCTIQLYVYKSGADSNARLQINNFINGAYCVQDCLQVDNGAAVSTSTHLTFSKNVITMNKSIRYVTSGIASPTTVNSRIFLNGFEVPL